MPYLKIFTVTALLLLSAGKQAWSDEVRGGFAPPQPTPSSRVNGQPPLPAAAPIRNSAQPNSDLRPLKDTLKMTSILIQSSAFSVCKTIPPYDDKLEQKTSSATQALKKITDQSVHISAHISFQRNFANFVGFSCCSPNKSYTPEDQKTAGCRASDTVAACMEKLAAHCTKESEKYHYATKEAIQDDIDNLQNAAAALTRLSQSLKELQTFVP
jgi:hypothetical protein